jgi:hypothetical protein
MKVYIVSLAGQGDVDIKVVDAATYNWIIGPQGDPKGKSGWKDKLCPESQRELMEAEGWKFPPEVTIGSYENDRAILARPMKGYASYQSITAAVKAIKKKGDKLDGDYEGLIY